MASPDPPWADTDAAEDTIVLEWRAVGRFTIRPDHSVKVEPARDAAAALVREFLQGPVAAVRLRQRGLLVLHGSAVTLNGRAVVLCGASGWGKSTLAAALHRRGHPVLADDYAAIRVGVRRPTLYTGPPLLKLWPDSAQVLGLDAAALPRVHPLADKRRVRTRRSPGARSVRLGQVVILAPGSLCKLAPLDPSEALIELLRHSYGARTLAALHPADHFARCAALVRTVPIMRLGAPRSLAQLPRLARLLEEHQA